MTLPPASGEKTHATADLMLRALLLAIPAALTLRYAVHAPGTAIFFTSAVAIIPLAGYMGRATEELAERVGTGLGGLLNATFGNAAELIIGIIALRQGLHDVVKASITGSIIGNILLVFGLGALLGGLRHPVQRFNRTAASLGATMLVLSAIGLVIPAIFHVAAAPVDPGLERGVSLEIAVVLMVSYGLSLVFSLRTHSHLYGVSKVVDATAASGVHPPLWRPLAMLLAPAATVGLMSELMVGALEEAAHAVGMSQVFVGVILVALVGNAAEHSTAVLMALKNKMDLAVQIAVGSSIQIALFVAPLLVFLSYLIGPVPMDLRFTSFEVVAVAASVGIMGLISQDGESHWMEGVQLLAVYVMLAIAFFFLPA